MKCQPYSQRLTISFLPGPRLLFILLCLLPLAAFPQKSRKQLEDRRKSLIKEIESTSKLLDNTRHSKEVTLNRFYTLDKQIQKRQELIITLQEEIRLTDLSMERAREVVEALSTDVENLKKEYASIARKAYRMKLTHNSLLFLFSATSLNDAFKRWQYLRQYDEFRQRQARLILETQETLAAKAQHMEEKKGEKEKLLASEITQQDILAKERQDSDVLLESLKKDESRLMADLDSKKKAHEDLNKAIEKAILTEIARQKEEEKKEKKPVNVAKGAKVPENGQELEKLSAVFNQNKGKLPWPVQNGVITRFFGTQPHPVLKNVKISNNGIDIQTGKSNDVKAVFGGEVVWFQFIPGNNYMIMLRHGNYFTVYTNLEEAFVKRGDKVEAGQTLGKVGIDRISNQPELHFEVWKDKERQDPVPWLRKTR